MIVFRILITLFVMVGAAIAVPRCSTSVYNTAFAFAGMNFSWLGIICVVIGIMVFRKIK